MCRHSKLPGRRCWKRSFKPLGRCRAAGVQPDAIIDEELQLVGAIEALETYHLRLLKIMAQERLTPLQTTQTPSS